MLYWRKVDRFSLYAPFLNDIVEFFLTVPYDFYVTEAFRTIEQSRVGYAAYVAKQGPRYAAPYKSAHNYGCAVDVVLDNSDAPGLQPSWDVKLEAWLYLKSRLIGSAKFNHLWRIGDWPHIEVKGWEELVHCKEETYEADLAAIGLSKPKPQISIV